MPKHPRRTRVYGPYPHGTGWRLILRAPDGTASYQPFEGEAEAARARRAIEAALTSDDAWERAAALEEQARRARAEAEAGGAEALTVRDLVDRFEAHQKAQGRKAGTIATARSKLEKILAPVMDEPARAITAARAGELYAARASTTRTETHRGDLRQARSLWTWAGKAGLVGSNPWTAVSPTGARSDGKEQLREHEAAAWYHAAITDAQASTDGLTGQELRWALQRREGALAALCTLLLGQRASEVIALQPRDVGSGWAWVARGKTRASRRRVAIPEPLRSLLIELAKQVRANGQPLLFPHRREWVRDNVRRICDKAGVLKVCAHSMRGLHATLAVDGGATGEAVAAQLGHISAKVTEKHYIDPAATAAAAHGRVLTVLQGGKKQGAA